MQRAANKSFVKKIELIDQTVIKVNYAQNRLLFLPIALLSELSNRFFNEQAKLKRARSMKTRLFYENTI